MLLKRFATIRRIDWKTIPIILTLMVISLIVISSTTSTSEERFITPQTLVQIRWFGLAWIGYFLAAAFDYRKLREWAWIFYLLMIIALVGLFFVPSIQNVHRWYKIPGIGREIQPSEGAKIIVIIALSWLIERRGHLLHLASTTLLCFLIVLIPFLLIIKQPDLGTSLVLYPTALVMFYFGGLPRRILLPMTGIGLVGVLFVTCMFTGVISHEGFKPIATTVLKEYQYERFNPETYHQKASQTAIALGGVSGSGWRKSSFTGGKWLPAAHTDSVFAAYCEEFGLLGVIVLLGLYASLLALSIRVTTLARDSFGRLLSAGLSSYLAIHILLNIGMMCGFFPITGIPLVLITFGGSAILTNMVALGLLQSIYSRRFLF